MIFKPGHYWRISKEDGNATILEVFEKKGELRARMIAVSGDRPVDELTLEKYYHERIHEPSRANVLGISYEDRLAQLKGMSIVKVGLVAQSLGLDPDKYKKVETLYRDVLKAEGFKKKGKAKSAAEMDYTH